MQAGDVVMALARKYAFSAGDAIYLELASRLASPIATLDRTLATATHASGLPVIGEGLGMTRPESNAADVKAE